LERSVWMSIVMSARSSDASENQHRLRAAAWLHDLRALPAISAFAQQALSLLQDPSSRPADIARIIGQDEALTTRVLQVVNSGFYALPGKVSTISHAVTLLGFQQVYLLVLSVALFQHGRFANQRAKANRELVWRHSCRPARAFCWRRRGTCSGSSTWTSWR
jgi:HD-like signal output (HDOD) protein